MKNKIIRILKVLFLVFVVLLLSYYLVYPLSTAVFATRSKRSDTGEAPKNFSEITLKTENGLTLSAWYMEPKNGKVVIVVHGAGGNKSTMQEYSNFFAENNYGVLAIDIEGHGKSEGQTNMFGWAGTRDIKTAVEYLKQKGEVKDIYAFGSSMGGEAVIGAAYETPEITKIITDGATHRSHSDFLDLRFTNRLLQEISYTKALYKYVELLTEEKAPAVTLVESIEKSNQTDFLFIAGDKPGLEADYNKLFLSKANTASEIWVAENTGHTGAFSNHKDTFKQKVLSFLNKS